MLEPVELEGLPLLTASALETDCGVFVAFTGREGGAGAGRFDSLNLSFDVADDRRTVLENRRRLSVAAGVRPDRWVTCRQAHGAGIRMLSPLDVGRGATDFASALPESDAMICELPEVACAILTADCLPLVIVDPSRPAAAVVHAGWRGALARVVERATSALSSGSTTTARSFVAFIGPHIRRCCLEMDEELALRFEREFGKRAVAGRHVDLSEVCIAQLESGGLQAGNVFMDASCTSCSSVYFSFRRDGETGRQAALVAIRAVG